MRASAQAAATPTESATAAPSPAESFGKRSASILGASAASPSAPHAIIARVRSAGSALPVAYAKSGRAAFLFCTYASTSIAMRCWLTSGSARASSSGFTARDPMRASDARAAAASSALPWRTRCTRPKVRLP